MGKVLAFAILITFLGFRFGGIVDNLHAEAADKFYFFVEFRDGSLLRLEFKEQTLKYRKQSRVGNIDDGEIKLSLLNELFFSEKPTLDLQAVVRAETLNLGDKSPSKRDAAFRKLKSMGQSIRSLLEKELEGRLNPEARERVLDILDDLPASQKAAPSEMVDRLHFGQMAVECDLGKLILEGRVNGALLNINRENCRKLFSLAPEMETLEGFAGFPRFETERIKEDKDDAWGADIERIDFEKDPEGNPLQAGENIENKFISLGCKLSTSIQNAIVSVNSYVVGGRSKGQSAATHQPLYQGEITIRFCLPGREDVPASVYQVGLWIAYVSPDGTSLVAYDRNDNVIQEIKTVNDGNDFLGLNSATPIAYVKIKPNPNVDPDYTFDDLTFSRPKAFGEAGLQGKYTLRFKTGEILFSKMLELEGDTLKVRLQSLKGQELCLSRRDLTQILPPLELVKIPGSNGDFMMLHKNGSLIEVKYDGKFKSTRFKNLAFQQEDVIALHGLRSRYIEPKQFPKNAKHFILLPEGGEELQSFKFEKGGIQIVRKNSLSNFYDYAKLPITWFADPALIKKSTARLQMINGEIWTLGEKGGFSLHGIKDASLILKREDEDFKIPMNQIQSFEFVSP